MYVTSFLYFSPFLSYLILPYPILSYPIQLISSLTFFASHISTDSRTTHHITSHHIISLLFLWDVIGILSYPFLFSIPLLSYSYSFYCLTSILPYRINRYPTLPYPTLPYPTLNHATHPSPYSNPFHSSTHHSAFPHPTLEFKLHSASSITKQY